MAKITVFDFCRQIGAASDEIPAVVKAGAQVIGRFSSMYSIPSKAAPAVLDAKVNFVTLKCSRDYHPGHVERLHHQAVTTDWEVRT